jgi:hypothetical protein
MRGRNASLTLAIAAFRIAQQFARARPLKPGCFGEIDAEAVAPALITSGHFGRGVAELLLHEALVNLGRGGEPGA